MSLLDNKTILITGAGGGLGEAIARVCHREGASVVVSDIRGDAALAVARDLGDERAIAVACDVSNDGQLRELVAKSIARFGRIDGLVNNAGVNFSKPFLQTTSEEWNRVISVDLRGVFFLTQFACEQMLRQTPPGGAIVNISSVHALASLPGAGPYDAAKAGVVGMARSIAVELAEKNIRVNTISPGLLNTQIWRDVIAAAPSYEECLKFWKSNIPIGRVIEPEEIGEIAAFLLSDRASAITGANIVADGGVTAQLISKEPYESKPLGTKS